MGGGALLDVVVVCKRFLFSGESTTKKKKADPDVPVLSDLSPVPVGGKRSGRWRRAVLVFGSSSSGLQRREEDECGTRERGSFLQALLFVSVYSGSILPRQGILGLFDSRVTVPEVRLGLFGQP